MTDGFVEHIALDAARVSATGNGLPADDYVNLAKHVLSRLVGMRIGRLGWMDQQDTDYLARILQACSQSHGDTPTCSQTLRRAAQLDLHAGEQDEA